MSTCTRKGQPLECCRRSRVRTDSKGGAAGSFLCIESATSDRYDGARYGRAICPDQVCVSGQPASELRGSNNNGDQPAMHTDIRAKISVSWESVNHAARKADQARASHVSLSVRRVSMSGIHSASPPNTKHSRR